MHGVEFYCNHKKLDQIKKYRAFIIGYIRLQSRKKNFKIIYIYMSVLSYRELRIINSLSVYALVNIDKKNQKN